MKSYLLFFLFFTPFFCFSQVSESFSDGNFTQNPTWTGTVSNFLVNNAYELQSAAPSASTSWLFTPSASVENAVWECRMKIDYPTSSSNYACMYIISDVNNLENGIKGYFVQVGGTNDEVSLFLQEGMQKVKIIDGVDKRTDGKPVEIAIKVTRDSLAVFRLYSRLPSETEYFLEGEVQNSKVLKSKFFGLSFTNTNTTGNCYYFDDILVTGIPVHDTIHPEIVKIGVENSRQLRVYFSEAMDFTNFNIRVNGEYVSILSQVIAANAQSIEIELDITFQQGMLYLVELDGLSDEAGNALLKNKKTVGITEHMQPGDIVFNEVMFHHADSSAEYIEVYNRSEKVLDLSGMIFTTRKTDGSLNSGNKIPDGIISFPGAYLALTNNVEAVQKHHACPEDAILIQTGWSALNNESATIVLTNPTRDTIYDEFSYQASMHHVLVKNPKGVALERIYPDFPTQDIKNWHSAAVSNNFGTPGFKNSQYRNMGVSLEDDERFFYLENQIFTPDNDGDNDICVLHYKFPENGYVFNITILNATGNKVLTLATQYLSGQQGVLTWDGRNQHGQLSNIGMYVFYIEIFNPDTGKRKHSKLPVVLSSR